MLKVENLSFGYQNLPLIKNLSFTVQPGELIQIDGPNGVGKSSLLKVIAGLSQADEGHIHRIDSLEYLSPEHNGLFLRWSAQDNLSFWAQPMHPSNLAKAVQTELNFWHLDDPWLATKLAVCKFSTGMKRRLALARVRLSNTKIWLLDEPAFGLDQSGLELLRMMIAQHLDQQGTIISVSHDHSVFAKLEDRTTTLTLAR